MAEALISDEAFIKGCAAIGAGLAVGLAGIGAGAGESGIGAAAVGDNSHLRSCDLVHPDVRILKLYRV